MTRPAILATLDAHAALRWNPHGGGRWACECGAQMAGDRDHAEVEHRDHLADLLVEVAS